jgi:hypothetical protein
MMFFSGARRFGVVVAGVLGRAVLWVAAVALACGIAAPAAFATSESQLARDLNGMWAFVIQAPVSQNPFTSTNNRCVHLAPQLLAPMQAFAPPGVSSSCTVKQGTRVFISELSTECSTAEPPPFHGNNPAQLRACDHSNLFGPNGHFFTHRVTFDGQNVPLTLVTAPPQQVNVPADNILGPPTPPAQQATSVAEGWLAVLHPMTPGIHQIVIHFGGTFLGKPGEEVNHITIIVKRRRH